jgi:hypothetical protein
MPRVVPSQVKDLIGDLFGANLTSRTEWLFSQHGTGLAAILSLADDISDELITLTGRDHSNYVLALETIRHQLSRWIQGDQNFMPFVVTDGGNARNAVLAVYEALDLCPDESPSPTTAALPFINDPLLRDSIRLDISAANRDMVNGEWKGATVLAGSATEALLLWAIQDADQQTPGTIANVAASLLAAGSLPRRPGSDPDRWTFIELIEAARQLALIEENTAKQARLGKDFRNLIHPGRAQRTGQVCDRGTALSALAAVEFVVRDLTP